MQQAETILHRGRPAIKSAMLARDEAGVLPVIFVGESEATTIRKDAVASLGDARALMIDAEVGAAPAATGSVCFVALPIGDAAAEVARLARLGCHSFLDTPRPPSVRDLQQLVDVAEEAGVSVGVSRPLRFAAGVAERSERSAIAVIEAEFGVGPECWQRGLSETLDLGMYLCKSTNTRNVEVSTERSDRVWPVFAAASLRFDNASLAILSLRRSAEPRPTRCMVTQGTAVRELQLDRPVDCYASETHAFLAAISRGERIPVAASDALAGARLLDQVLALMR